ncbi:MAG: NAD(P)H-binding protein, partial [Solirubrobacteraceae bacterium]
MRILLTGATGFVGSTLIAPLLRAGDEVRALARDPSQLPAGPLVSVRGDLVTGEGLAEALDAVEVAYYLVHSMERPRPDSMERRQPDSAERLLAGGALGRAPFQLREREAALRFAEAARAA